MTRCWELAKRAVHLGPRLAAEKGVGLVQRQWQQLRRRSRDLTQCSFAIPADISPGMLSYLSVAPSIATSDWPLARSLAKRYAEHQFDLLGSGWCQVVHGMKCNGVNGHRYHPGEAVNADADGRWLAGRINRTNLAAAQHVWRAIEPPYQPIDWQLDFKCGYRWSERTWHSRTPFGHLPGVDIKVPWELSRMQHLPQMAIAAAHAKRVGEDGLAITLEREFRNQTLDFIACNPPRFGVNWRCAMDVGIRAANWLLAYDLFLAGGMRPDETFSTIFSRSIAAHGQHLIENLEWQRLHRGNHYLADISGLLFVAAYLPSSPRVDAWLAFAVRQFSNELLRQFTPDGANFEASTSYHRLSAEMAAFGSALILGLSGAKQESLSGYDHRYVTCQPGLEPAPLQQFDLPQDTGVSPLPPECFERLARMAEFSCDATKPDGQVHQLGDNDSGRFFKLWPTFRPGSLETELEENHLDHRGLAAAIGSLTGRNDLIEFSGESWPEISLIRQLARHRSQKLPFHTLRVPYHSHAAGAATRLSSEIEKLASEAADSTEYRIGLTPGVTANVAARAYPDFGLYIWRGERLYLAVRCGPTGQEGNGGHAHNDQLAIELQIDGEERFADVGTYLYTADPVRRNEYRSAKAHFVPRVAPFREPGNLNLSLFQLPDTTQSRCQFFGPDGFIGHHSGYGNRVTRTVQLLPNQIVIQDFAEAPLKLARDVFAAEVPSQSLGYGLRKAA